MKLFVWTEVLANYTDGMAVALAPDLETALRLLTKEAGYSLDLPVDKMQVIDLADSPEPQSWYVYGGG